MVILLRFLHKEPVYSLPKLSLEQSMDSTDQEKQYVATEAEQEIIRLWRAWRTVHEMCNDRVA